MSCRNASNVCSNNNNLVRDHGDNEALVSSGSMGAMSDFPKINAWYGKRLRIRGVSGELQVLGGNHKGKKV